MNSARILDRQVTYIIGVVILVFMLLVPVVVAAAQVTERSIELSSSSAAAQSVNYKVNFKAGSAAEAFVLEFCSDTPIIGQACTAPTGFTVASATIASGATILDKAVANKLVIAREITANETVSVIVAGLQNPSAAGVMYARIVTYSDAESAQEYASNNLGDDVVDQGSVAISITPTVGISAAVLESITFCLSAVALQANCGGATPPIIQLGETIANTKALNAGFVSTGNIYTQLSTNAGTGAVVSLKSSAVGCGGLVRADAPDACDIVPAQNTGIVAGEAKFGVRTGESATDTTGAGITPSGVLQASGLYNATTYVLNYSQNNSAGVTGPYGDPLLNTNSKPVNNKNMQLIFGASVANDTPAGLYSADMSLVATGKF
jgi:hypothetical protein